MKKRRTEQWAIAPVSLAKKSELDVVAVLHSVSKCFHLMSLRNFALHEPEARQMDYADWAYSLSEKYLRHHEEVESWGQFETWMLVLRKLLNSPPPEVDEIEWGGHIRVSLLVQEVVSPLRDWETPLAFAVSEVDDASRVY